MPRRRVENKRRQRPAVGDPQPASAAAPLRILVVGDWVVDDHWVTGIHRSLTRSRVGELHLRALHGPDSTPQALCGAGRTASILHEARLGERPFCRIAGIGLWHIDDTAALAAMLDPRQSTGQTPHRLTLKPTGAA